MRPASPFAALPRADRLGLLPRLVVTLLTGSLLTGGCQILQQLPVHPGAGGGAVTLAPPTVTFRGATLSRAPSRRMLAATYCPKLVAEKIAFGGAAAASLLCTQAFGAPPRLDESQIAFDLAFNVANPNRVPLPLAEILTGVHVFPEATNQNLGAVCMKLCPPGDAACNGQPGPDSCRASSKDIRSIDDLGRAAVGFLLTQGLRLAAGEPPSFRAPQIIEASSLDVTVRFAFAPEQMLPVIEQVARQAVEQLKAGQEVEFKIPYRIEGSVWVDGGSIGRLAAGYGPVAGEWVIPQSALLP